MKRTILYAAIALCVGLSILLLLRFSGFVDHTDRQTSAMGFLSNDAFITGLYTGIRLDSAEEVLDYVLQQIGDEATVYPSENYYYFKFTASGKNIAGSLHLILNDTNDLRLGLGYVQKVEDKQRQKDYAMPGGSLHYHNGKGKVSMRMLDDSTCKVTCRGKSVIFHLYQPDLGSPEKARLLPEEKLVGPSFDESGLQFYLLFNTKGKCLYWILNEDAFVPETFARISQNVVVGNRTEFAFYLDSANNRKVLIGVEAKNVLDNNWYDGPFDQMPDNYVRTGAIEVLPYLEAHYPYHKGNMNKYGRFLDREGARVPVAPYRVYWDYEDLSFVEGLEKDSLSATDFYKALTRQIFFVPGDYWY